MMSRKKVEKSMLKIGIPAGYKGFQYIADAMMLLDEPEWKDPKFTPLYEAIGRQYGVNGSRVERGIRYAFNMARKGKDESDIIWQYIGHSGKTNVTALMMLHKVLQNECGSQIPDNIKADMPESMESLRDMIRHEIRMFFYNAFMEDI